MSCLIEEEIGLMDIYFIKQVFSVITNNIVVVYKNIYQLIQQVNWRLYLTDKVEI